MKLGSLRFAQSSQMGSRRHSRRRFLQGLGGLSLGLPWLEKLEGTARAQTAGPRRVLVVSYSMGVPHGAWMPGSDMSLPYVTEPLTSFVDRSLFVSSIDNTVLETGGDPFVWGHPAKHEAALTGTLTTGAFPTVNNNHVSEVRPDAITDGGANSASVEHIIGEFLYDGHPLHSVDLGVDGDSMADWGGKTPVQSSQFCFEGRGNAISLNLMPGAAFNALFGGLDTGEGSAEQDALRRLRERNKSVLDAVRDSFADLRQGLGTEDQRRLDEHAQRIREVELDLALTDACQIPQDIEALDSYQGFRMDQLAPLQIRMLSHAMGCDLAPVGRLDFVNQQNPRFGVEELDTTLDAVDGEFDWHGMVHGDPLPGTETFLRPGRDESVTDYDPRLLDGYRFFVQQYAALLTELDAIAEGPDTSVLDNSLVILASDLGEGLGHGHGKMGYILSGNLGGAKPGTHLDASAAGSPFDGSNNFYVASRYNVNQLLNSILDIAGVTDEQGQPVTMGLDGFLEQIGAPRRIDELFG